MIIIAIYIIGVLYLIILLLFIYGLAKIKNEKVKLVPQEIGLSVVIPFRNEEHNLENVYQSLKKQRYPSVLVEVLFVNDYSTDNGKSVLTNLIENEKYFKLIDNDRNPGKKNALEQGILAAANEIIITSDADCTMHEHWIETMLCYKQHFNSRLLVGPVKMITKGTLFSSLLNLEFSALLAATYGSIGIGKAFMCNGANLAFDRQLFIELDPFASNRTIASGDDVFLLHVLKKKYPKDTRIHVANSEKALVYTEHANSIEAFIHQRVRWAKKGLAYKDVFSLFLGILILLMNCSILYLFLAPIFGATQTGYCLGILIAKAFIDIGLVFSLPKWLKPKDLLIGTIVLMFIYPFYMAVVALLSLLFRPVWKGRKI